jgi:histidine ammonia-lyase
MTVTIDGQKLKGRDVIRAARPAVSGRFEKTALNPLARGRIEATRAYIEKQWLHDDAPMMYGFNTGLGLFKDTRVTIADMAQYQQSMIFAHATGVGEPFEREVVRATMLLRANAFASNYSGPQVAVVDRLLAFLNAGLHPVVPKKGSVGASGDLAPLAYIAGGLCGYAKAQIEFKGKTMPAPEAIRRAGLSSEFSLGVKDASALINGSTVSLALAVLAAHDARRLRKNADIALALTCEAMRAEPTAFDSRIHAARPHPGQIRVAENMRRLLSGSRRTTQAARQILFPEESRDPQIALPPRIQDVYSLRCAPQVHGPVLDGLDYIDRILAVEINSATDNPLIFATPEGGYEIISGGNFHGQYLAQATDLLSIALADLGSICERRLARLIDPGMSFGLPRNLNAGKRGLNTGFPTVQCSMSALVMENRTLATPGSVDSIPGKGNSEDHVSNSTWCARKARTILENTEQIVAGEMLLAAQALSLVEPLTRDFPLATATSSAFAALRGRIAPALEGDRWWHADMAAALEMVRDGTILDAVEGAIGALH